MSYITNPNKIGLVVGTLIAAWHALWVLFILLGWAQPLLDFVFWAHMIKSIYVVKAFDPVAALTLIVITFISGYAFGFVGGLLWNKLHRAS